MPKIFKVLKSRHRGVYFRLARKFGTTPVHVYNLAHGGSVNGQKDTDIIHELLDLKIVHRHHYSQNPDDYEMD